MSEEFPFLADYDGQSTGELLALEGQFRIDSLVLAFEEALSSKAIVNAQERTVLAVEAIEREVNNGGFNQFFANSSRDHWPYASDALCAIGCPKTSALLQEAARILGITETTAPDEIEVIACEATEAQDEQLSRLDDVYYQGHEGPIADKLFEFIKRNHSMISVP